MAKTHGRTDDGAVNDKHAAPATAAAGESTEGSGASAAPAAVATAPTETFSPPETESDVAASLEARWAREAGQQEQPADQPSSESGAGHEAGESSSSKQQQDADPPSSGPENDDTADDAKPSDAGDDPEEGAVVPDEDEDAEDGSEDSEDGEGDAAGKSSEWPEAARERVGKLTRQRNEARDRAAESEARLHELEQKLRAAERAQVTLPPTPENPLADVASEDALAAREREARAVLAWAEQNLEGAEARDPSTGEVREYSAAEVSRLLRQAERELERHIPARREYLQRQTRADEQARRLYPQLYRAGSEAEQFASSVLRDAPGIVNAADHAVILGDAWVGAMVRSGRFRLVKAGGATPSSTEGAAARAPKQQQAAAQATAPQAKPAPAAPEPEPPRSLPPSAPRKTSAAAKADGAALSRFTDSGRTEDLAAVLEQRLFAAAAR